MARYHVSDMVTSKSTAISLMAIKKTDESHNGEKSAPCILCLIRIVLILLSHSASS
jgi:hypothetical protein